LINAELQPFGGSNSALINRPGGVVAAGRALAGFVVGCALTRGTG
jgi:hypothetical protein